MMANSGMSQWGKTVMRPTLEQLPQQDRDVHRLLCEMPDDKSIKRIAMQLGISFDEVRVSMRRLMHRAPNQLDAWHEYHKHQGSM